MKVRVLYPTALGGTDHKDAEAGAEVTMDDDLAKALIPSGAVEEVAAKTTRAKKES